MKSLQIGMLAYGVDPTIVMVRVPNERGRWIATDRCVVEVGCPQCGAVVGEPCRRITGSYYRRHMIDPPPTPISDIRYGISVHIARKSVAQQELGGRNYAARRPPHKLRINADELAQIQTPITEE